MSRLTDLAAELDGGEVAGWATMGATELAAVRRTSRQQRDATRRRDDAIATAAAAGHSLRDIGDAAELSHSGVRKILERRSSSSDAGEVVDDG